jgi:hypothetical protein
LLRSFLTRGYQRFIMADKYCCEVIDFLLGKSPSCYHQVNNLLRLRSPFLKHIKRLSKFHDRPVCLELEKPSSTSPRQKYLDKQLDYYPPQDMLEFLLEPTVSRGFVLIAIEHHKGEGGVHDGHYRPVYWAPEDILGYREDDCGCILFLEVKEYLTIDDKLHVAKRRYDTEAYSYWKPIPSNREAELSKLPPSKVVPHRYGHTPVVTSKNTSHCLPDFDSLAIDLAVEIVAQYARAAESYTYFTKELIVSPFVKQTEKALRSGDRVIPKPSGETGNSVDVLKMSGLPDTWQNWIDNLECELSEHLGTPIIDKREASLNRIASELMESATLRTAENKFRFTGDAVKCFYECCLKFAAIDGYLVDVSRDNEESWCLSIYYTQEAFPQSAEDRLKRAGLTNQIIGLGLDPVFVIAKELYPSMSEAEVKARMVAEPIIIRQQDEAEKEPKVLNAMEGRMQQPDRAEKNPARPNANGGNSVPESRG